MSDTPRTDAYMQNATIACPDDQFHHALAIAQQLERELAAERERADRNEKDAERYRFGRNDGVVVQISVLRDDTRWVRCEDDLDAAIDAAMKEGK